MFSVWGVVTWVPCHNFWCGVRVGTRDYCWESNLWLWTLTKPNKPSTLEDEAEGLSLPGQPRLHRANLPQIHKAEGKVGFVIRRFPRRRSGRYKGLGLGKRVELARP